MESIITESPILLYFSFGLTKPKFLRTIAKRKNYLLYCKTIFTANQTPNEQEKCVLIKTNTEEKIIFCRCCACRKSHSGDCVLQRTKNSYLQSNKKKKTQNPFIISYTYLFFLSWMLRRSSPQTMYQKNQFLIHKNLIHINSP